MDSLILFIGSTLDRARAPELDDISRRSRADAASDLSAIVSTFGSTSTTPMPWRSRTRSSLERADAVRSRRRLPSGPCAQPALPPCAATRAMRLRFIPSFPGRLRSCFIEASETFCRDRGRSASGKHTRPAGVNHGKARTRPGARRPSGRQVGLENRAYTLLGENRPWRAMLFRPSNRGASGKPCRQPPAPFFPGSWSARCCALVAAIFAVVFPGCGNGTSIRCRLVPCASCVSLCHRGNIGHVRVVGYNNGVNHFGHRYPGKTIVSTVRCRRMTFAGSQAQGGLRGDGPRCPGLSRHVPTRNSTSSRITPTSAWAPPSSCRSTGRPSITPRWRTRSAGSSSTTRTAIGSRRREGRRSVP